MTRHLQKNLSVNCKTWLLFVCENIESSFTSKNSAGRNFIFSNYRTAVDVLRLFGAESQSRQGRKYHAPFHLTNRRTFCVHFEVPQNIAKPKGNNCCHYYYLHERTNKLFTSFRKIIFDGKDTMSRMLQNWLV